MIICLFVLLKAVLGFIARFTRGIKMSTEVFDKDFKMGDLVPEYKGMELKDARIKIVEKLEEIGALVNTEDYTHNVAKCERCKNTIEPKVSEHWFVSMKDLAKRAADSVRNGEAKFVPQRYEKQYFHWWV